jgi:D-alanyl-D-alanine carboxypeptidase
VVGSGVADIKTGAPLAADARFRAGSIAKTFVAAAVMQLAGEGKLSLDRPVTELLPADLTDHFQNSDKVTLRMLLDHTSGIPEWLTPEMIQKIGADPTKVWDVTEFLDVAAAQTTTFAPGEGWAYSNTDYNLIGLIIERATGKSWREVVRERIIAPLGLVDTTLPAPGDTAIGGEFMHGYVMVDGKVVDISAADPSMAGAAGGGALVTTVNDLAKFLAALRSNKPFPQKPDFADMITFVPAQGEGGRVGYGLGIEKYLLPGNLEMIGHLGGTAGYVSGTFYFPGLDLSIAFVMSANESPLPVIMAALTAAAP